MFQMPLLEEIASKDTSNFDGCLLICCQHVLPTNVRLFKILLEKGLLAENCHILGKCYSTNSDAYDEISSMGINISPLSKAYSSHHSFDEQYPQYVKAFTDSIIGKTDVTSFKKIILIDDGGELLSYVLEKIDDHTFSHPSITGIEQTSSGYNKLLDKKLQFPIINVARSDVKLHYESINVAALAYKNIIQALNDVGIRFPERILVIGGGPIGVCLKERFIQHNPDILVDIYDIISAKSTIQINNLDSLKKYDMIIGCTGTSSFPHEYFSYMKDNVILVSNSSADREFDATFLRKRIAVSNDPHKHIRVEKKILLDSGFPITFHGGVGFSFTHAQLTRSLMYSGVVQAVTSNHHQPSFIMLSELSQEVIKKSIYFQQAICVE